MHAEASVHAFERTFCNHRLRTAANFFCRLESEHHCALELILNVMNHVHGSEQHRDVAVMTARMHHTRIRAGIRQSGFLLHRQSVNIAAQENRAARLLPGNTCERPCAHTAGAPLHTQLVEFCADALRRFEFLGAFFRMLMEVATHFDLIVSVFSNKVLKCHFNGPETKEGAFRGVPERPGLRLRSKIMDSTICRRAHGKDGRWVKAASQRNRRAAQR